MNGASVQSYQAALQLKYLPGLRRQFNDDYPLLRFIKQNSEAVNGEGEKAVILLELGLNEGGGWHGESADVPNSGTPQFKRTEVSIKQITFRTRITYRLMRKAKTTAASFVRGAQHQMSATREAFTMTANQYLWGDGSGVMARVVSWNSGTRTLVLNKKYGIDDGGSPEAIIRRGQRLHLLDTKGYSAGVSADRGYGIVQTTDELSSDTQLTCVIESGHTFAGVTAGDYVYLQNGIRGWFDPGESQDNRPAMGMLGFYDETLCDELQNLSPTVAVGSQAAEPSWKGRTVDVTSNATAIRDFRKAKIKVQKQTRMGRIAYLISSYEAHESFCSVLDQKVEFRNVTKIDGSWDVATYDGRPWFLDHTAPAARTFIVPQGMTIQRYAVDEFINLVDEDGNVLHQVPNKTVFDAMLTASYEYGITRRNNLVQITGLDF